MIELFLILVLVLAAKRGRGRRRKFNLRRVRLNPEMPLLTPASDIVVLQAMTAVAVSTYRAISVKVMWTLMNLTSGEGPVTVGLAHSDYTVTEIKECLEAQAGIDPGNKVEQERANRMVRVVGSFSGGGGGQTLNDGKPISTKLNWLIAIGRTVVMWAYNEDTATLTTGAVLNVSGNLWVKDSA